jgi:hypothetical protein
MYDEEELEDEFIEEISDYGDFAEAMSGTDLDATFYEMWLEEGGDDDDL